MILSLRYFSSQANIGRILLLEHDPEKPALGLDPRVDAGFRT
jgi:hypothetical protein